MSDFLTSPTTSPEDRPDVSALAGSVVSMLRDSNRFRGERRILEVAEMLERRVLQKGMFSSEDTVAEALLSGLNRDDIVDRCIPIAARSLGAAWCEDDLSFADVTIGSARLQGLLSVLAPPLHSEDNDIRNPSLLLVIPEGDTHTLGPHVVGAQLRRRAASVQMLFAPSTDMLGDALRADPYDGVLFSCSRPQTLSGIGKMISSLKHSIPVAPPTILGGLVLDLVPNPNELAGADLATNDAVEALRYCLIRINAGYGSKKCRETGPRI